MDRRIMLMSTALLGAMGLRRLWEGFLPRTAWADGEGSVVHWPSNLSKLQGLELDHVPLLKVHPAEYAKEHIDLEIRIGKRLHEMSRFHSIRWLQIWIDKRKVCQMSLSPQGMVPQWRFTFLRGASMQVTVKVGCNRHGIWANRLVI